jgi:hypothetical protein
MRKIKDVLRLKLDASLSHQQIARALDISKCVVTKYVRLAAVAGLDWTAVQDTRICAGAATAGGAQLSARPCATGFRSHAQ